jgi:hypothetical protein
MLKGAHRADADIILTANILMHIIHQLNIENIEQLYIASEEARIPRILLLVNTKVLRFKIFQRIISNGFYAKTILISIYVRHWKQN